MAPIVPAAVAFGARRIAAPAMPRQFAAWEDANARPTIPAMEQYFLRRVTGALIAVMASTVSALAQPPAQVGASDRTTPVAIRFAASVGDKPFSCTEKYEGIGTTGSAVQVTDFRFFASNVRLVRADGGEVPVKLAEDGLWQTSGIALVDFEDATGTCVNGTPETRHVIEGTAPAGDYVGVRFALGLPLDLNHREVTLQPSPLNLSRMFWSWNAGYKFMRLDLRSTGQPKGWMVHLGSTGCTPDGSPSVPAVSCKNPNLSAIDVPYRLGRDEIRLDLKALLAESNVDVNQEKTAMGCMSGSTDGECAPLFKQLGLAIGAQSAGMQRVFSVRPAATTMAAPR